MSFSFPGPAGLDGCGGTDTASTRSSGRRRSRRRAQRREVPVPAYQQKIFDPNGLKLGANVGGRARGSEAA
jgi:hypothetical protein